MKLDAVTVCVHESDSLALTLDNRTQFDRWLIVTVPGDRLTMELCRERGLDCHLSRVLQPDGLDILAGSNRARAVAEGLAALGATGWVAMISSYVLLPRRFRAQLEAAPMDGGARYGLGAFRRCTNRRMFERLKACEPWRPDAKRASDESWFELIDAGSSRPAGKTALPLTALLLSDSALHWGAGILESERVAIPDRRGLALREMLAGLAGADRPRLLLAGFHPALDPADWAPLCGQIAVSDDFALKRQTGDAAADAARAGLRESWRVETDRLGTFIEVDQAGAAAADGSFDALYIPGEASVERLAVGLPLWRSKLKDRALVCGDLYGHDDWEEASLAIAQFFGAPDAVAPSGFWHRRFDRHALPPIPDAAHGPSVILVNPPGGDPGRAMTSLHALRRYWPGRIVVQDEQNDSVELAAACARYGAERRHESVAPSGECLRLAAGILPQRPVDDLFRSLRSRSAVAKLAASARDAAVRTVRALRGRKPLVPPAGFSDARGRIWVVPTERASVLSEAPSDMSQSLIRYGDSPDRWSPAARRLWSRMAGERAAKLASLVPVASDSTILVIIGPERVPEFECNWPGWKFRSGVPVVAGCVGVAQAALDWSGRPPQEIVELAPAAGGNPRGLLGALLQRVRTGRVILLPVGARALPGATLFMAPDWSLAPIAFHSTVEVLRVNGVLPMPWRSEPLLVSAATDLMHGFCMDEAGDRPDVDLKSWMQNAARRSGVTWELCNVERWGWRVR